MTESSTGRNGHRAPELPILPSPVPEHPLDAQLTPRRAARYRQVLLRRTARIAVVIEDCHDPHNATAVTRSCDAFGVSPLHVVIGKTPYRVNRRVSGGSHHHVDVQTHLTTEDAIAQLRKDGYALAVSAAGSTSLPGPQCLVSELGAQPLALFFGNEHDGVSDYALDQADYRFSIPMVGFVQSLNLSVAVAITLYTLRQDALVESAAGDLSDAEQVRMYDEWVRRYRGEAGEKYLRRLGRGNEPLDVYANMTSGPNS